MNFSTVFRNIYKENYLNPVFATKSFKKEKKTQERFVYITKFCLLMLLELDFAL